MGTALLELMKEKPIEKISIEEMTAKADVGCSTYFRYSKSKDEVLSFNITCLWKSFSDEHGATTVSYTHLLAVAPPPAAPAGRQAPAQQTQLAHSRSVHPDNAQHRRSASAGRP